MLGGLVQFAYFYAWLALNLTFYSVIYDLIDWSDLISVGFN